MWNPLNRGSADCRAFQEALEVCASGSEVNIAESLPEAQRQHLARCRECETSLQELVETRVLLSAIPSNATPGPWFAPRVMAAIAAQESKLTRALETWTAVPRLAARLTWLSALALLLASTWLYSRPMHYSVNSVATDVTGEPLVETPTPVTNDDVLVSLVEKSR
ncbi:MAG TPA: hypothetical protein VGI16_09580 [Candidatus Acidoferrum sp.]|jgi:hypothetical protein